jgi:hypothetical protein
LPESIPHQDVHVASFEQLAKDRERPTRARPRYINMKIPIGRQVGEDELAKQGIRMLGIFS